MSVGGAFEVIHSVQPSGLPGPPVTILLVSRPPVDPNTSVGRFQDAYLIKNFVDHHFDV